VRGEEGRDNIAISILHSQRSMTQNHASCLLLSIYLHVLITIAYISKQQAEGIQKAVSQFACQPPNWVAVLAASDLQYASGAVFYRCRDLMGYMRVSCSEHAESVLHEPRECSSYSWLVSAAALSSLCLQYCLRRRCQKHTHCFLSRRTGTVKARLITC
jgi:hypothetical protein